MWNHFPIGTKLYLQKAAIRSIFSWAVLFQVPPAELEDLLRQLPEVQDVAVIGIPHER